MYDMAKRKRPPSHPGSILFGDYLEPLGITLTATAKILGVSRKTVSKLVNHRGAVTPDMALRLSQAFGTTPDLWLNLQRNYDLWYAVHADAGWRTVKLVEGLPHANIQTA